MNGWFAGLLFLLPQASAQAVPPRVSDSLTFSIEREGQAVNGFAIQVDQTTGRGFYTPRNTTENTNAGAAPGSPTPIAVGPPLLKQLFASLPAITQHRCESHSHNLAQTGKKTLRFAHSDAVAECTFNYSDDERVNNAAAIFLALAQTLDFGQRLASKLRFDRLGLDRVMDDLTDAVKDGRAVEIGNIAPVLRTIESDDRVLERVRRKAASLLESAGLPAAQPTGDAAVSDR